MKWLWIELPDRTLGLEHGFIPKGSVREFEQAAGLVQSMYEVLHDQQSIRQRAEEEALRALEAAREAGRIEAAQCVATAQEEAARLRDLARDEGFAAGMAEATLEWHRRRHAAALAEADTLAGLRAVMVRIVCAAVERVISSESPRALYDKALAQVGDLMAGRAAGVLRVHPDRLEPARQAAAHAQQAGDSAWVIRVVADAALGEGGCVFESDHGILDASLELQLNALSRALGRALDAADSLPQPAEAWDAAPNDGETFGAAGLDGQAGMGQHMAAS